MYLSELINGGLKECWDFDGDTCQRCDGEGEIMVCYDDLCQGQGYCIHGDGYAPCPACNGAGES